jgi:hypothetical protein
MGKQIEFELFIGISEYYETGIFAVGQLLGKVYVKN